jgi:hypothetical protein
MAPPTLAPGAILLALCVLLVVLPSPAAAFGAGNIPSIAQVEGVNWRHGDIEDMLKTVAFLKGHKWTSMMIKRVYFGNWLRDYSQAVDVGSLKGVPAPTIRILVWVLSFLSFGYATVEFEVTQERLGVYRPEEHIDNPKDYANNIDARTYDPRLRGPVQPVELQVDPNTGMKNYIANEHGGWATSAGYVKFSLTRSIHFGRLYTSGARGTSGREEDLCEALRCLGQALHCLEDFGAHTNYCELALRELGLNDVFAHCGHSAQINLRGHQVFPLVTGTFGAVDFLHSVLGEATDHFTQTEVDEMDIALKTASDQSNSTGQRGVQSFVGLLGQIPGVGRGFADQARSLQAVSEAQQQDNDRSRAAINQPSQGGSGFPGLSADMDPVQVAAKIYPIMEFRDRIVKAISSTIAKIPGLESLVEKISETLTLFVLSLLAPFVRPIIEKVSASLKTGSSGVVHASEDQQFGPWNDPQCTDPTHSMLSKDHFTNVLNPCAGRVAATILQYVVPRVLYAWEHPGIPVDEVLNDIVRVFHHPAVRDESLEIHRNMFNTVRKWVDEVGNRTKLNNELSSSSVRAGRNHKLVNERDSHSHNSFRGLGEETTSGGPMWAKITSRDLGEMSDGSSAMNYLSSSPRAGSPVGANDFGYNNSQQPPYATGGPTLQPEGMPPYGAYQQNPSMGYNQPPYGASYQQGGPWNAGPPPPMPPYGGGFQAPYDAAQFPGAGYPPQPPYGAPPYGGGYNQY